MPQSTVSRWLARLRLHFNDPLFVKTQDGMSPTPAAVSHAGPISEMVRIYQTRLRNAGNFDPATTVRDFNIAASDMGTLLVLPALHRWSEMVAPSARFTAMPLGRQELITGLETGDVDLALGHFKELYGGVRSQTLDVDQYVCVMRSEYLDQGKSLSLDAFRQARHILVDAHAMGHTHQLVERQLLQVCPPENIRIVAESFVVAGLLLDLDDFILTVPSRVAKFIARGTHFTVTKPPIELPQFKVTQYWHERFHNDPGNQWLRRAICQIFTTYRSGAVSTEEA